MFRVKAFGVTNCRWFGPKGAANINPIAMGVTNLRARTHFTGARPVTRSRYAIRTAMQVAGDRRMNGAMVSAMARLGIGHGRGGDRNDRGEKKKTRSFEQNIT
jgi:hypothetical protein